MRALEAAGFGMAAGARVTTIHGRPLDWIFVRGPASFDSGEVHDGVRVSDHFPVTVQVRLEHAGCSVARRAGSR